MTSEWCPFLEAFCYGGSCAERCALDVETKKDFLAAEFPKDEDVDRVMARAVCLVRPALRNRVSGLMLPGDAVASLPGTRHRAFGADHVEALAALREVVRRDWLNVLRGMQVALREGTR